MIKTKKSHAEFCTPDGGSPTKDRSPIKKTDDVVGLIHVIKTNGNRLCSLVGIYKEVLKFFNLRMDFLFK